MAGQLEGDTVKLAENERMLQKTVNEFDRVHKNSKFNLK